MLGIAYYMHVNESYVSERLSKHIQVRKFYSRNEYGIYNDSLNKFVLKGVYKYSPRYWCGEAASCYYQWLDLYFCGTLNFVDYDLVGYFSGFGYRICSDVC